MASGTFAEISPLEASIISVVEHHSYSELGLGRGVDVTDQDMWKSKHRFQIRKISPDLGNIIGTRECGKLERYARVVSTFATQQQQLLLSLDNPYVKIGMDEHFSRSTSTTKLIEGQKIETRTISFQFHFDEVPLYSNVENVIYVAPNAFMLDCEDLCFEKDLYCWILKRIEDREIKEKGISSIDARLLTSESQLTSEAMKLIQEKIERSSQPENQKIRDDCSDFIRNMGITHYVNAITLGACRYRIVTSKSEQWKVGGGAGMSVNSIAEGGLSGSFAKHWYRMTEKEEMIGRMTDKKVEAEAVIGFQVQPLYKLVRIQLVQASLREAIKEYIINDKCGESSLLTYLCMARDLAIMDKNVVSCTHPCKTSLSSMC